MKLRAKIDSFCTETSGGRRKASWGLEWWKILTTVFTSKTSLHSYTKRARAKWLLHVLFCHRSQLREVALCLGRSAVFQMQEDIWALVYPGRAWLWKRSQLWKRCEWCTIPIIIEMCHSLGHDLGKAEKGYCYCELRESERKLRIIMLNNQWSALWTLLYLSFLRDLYLQENKHENEMILHLKNHIK